MAPLTHATPLCPHPPGSNGPTDDEIALAIDSTNLAATERTLESLDIIRISDRWIVKLGVNVTEMESEALAMDTVRKETSIPVPGPIRVFRHRHEMFGDGVLVMEYIPNSRTLGECWPTLTANEKDNVVETLAEYVRQLRRIRVEQPNRPGPLGPEPGLCLGLQFATEPRGPISEAGPYPDVASLYENFHRKHGFRMNFHRRWNHPEFDGPEEADFSPLVFTHNDLNMRNVLLGDSGRLWIVDWAWSGMFPKSFEYLAMLFAARQTPAPEDWIAAIPRMVEPHERMLQWMSNMGRAYDI